MDKLFDKATKFLESRNWEHYDFSIYGCMESHDDDVSFLVQLAYSEDTCISEFAAKVLTEDCGGETRQYIFTKDNWQEFMNLIEILEKINEWCHEIPNAGTLARKYIYNENKFKKHQHKSGVNPPTIAPVLPIVSLG